MLAEGSLRRSIVKFSFSFEQPGQCDVIFIFSFLIRRYQPGVLINPRYFNIHDTEIEFFVELCTRWRWKCTGHGVI